MSTNGRTVQSCLTMIALLFCDFTSLQISWAISWTRSGSRLAVGSSARISCGLPMKARAIAARVCRRLGYATPSIVNDTKHRGQQPHQHSVTNVRTGPTGVAGGN